MPNHLKTHIVFAGIICEDRAERLSDVIKQGDLVTVKLVAIDDRGRLQLSMKAAAKELSKK